ncbi:hypothetical protein [Aeromicrobium sp. UC242_57]|uniref:hypothetical protein n=1 Tax=Aeromicrobium sp. UC242_57 TaxID=3374624 RepID=UPI0037B29C08
MSSARADFSGSVFFHAESVASLMACSTLRIRASNSPIFARGTLPAASQRSAMSSQALRAASTFVIGSKPPASARISASSRR